MSRQVVRSETLQGYQKQTGNRTLLYTVISLAISHGKSTVNEFMMKRDGEYEIDTRNSTGNKVHNDICSQQKL